MVSCARFEFRAWARNFAIVEDRIRRLASCEDIRESRETYFIAPKMRACNVKLRDGAMETKALIDKRDGLEQWQPEWQGQFPLSADDLRRHVFAALGVEAPSFECLAYTEEQTLDDVVRPRPNIATVMVFKRRFSFSVLDCMVEWTQVEINGAGLESVAIESLEANPVVEARHGLGLARFQNVSYPRLIQHVTGVKPLRGGFEEGSDFGSGN